MGNFEVNLYDNATPEWLAPVLRGYADGSTGLEPLAVEIEEGLMGYAEPIIVQPLCLTCHGDVQDPALLERIKADYPEDRATGFEAGELRGVFWIEYPVADQSE